MVVDTVPEMEQKHDGEIDLQPNDDMARPFMVGEIICRSQPARRL